MIVDPLPEAWRFDAIGAPWRIDSRVPLAPVVQGAISARVRIFDLAWSRFRPDSWVSLVSMAAPGDRELPVDGPELLGLYRELHTATAGRVSPLVGRRLETLGYDAAYRLAPAAELAPVPEWEAVLRLDGERLELLEPALLDVGAAGKGRLVDLVGGLLDTAGVTEWFVDASGDLRARGIDPAIALEHPADPTRAIGIGRPGERALCASAVTRRAWGEGLHHVLDAVTGLPTRTVVATWAIADTAMVADGAATALFFDVDPAFLARHRVEHVRLFSDGRVDVSPDWPGEVFT